MSVLTTLASFLGLPIRALIQIIFHYTYGSPYRKFRNDIIQALKLTLFRTAIMFPVFDAKYINLISAPALVKKVLPLRFSKTTKTLPGYGEKYDENSFWLVKQPNRTKDDPILVFLHGGGFYVEVSSFQMESILALYQLVVPEKRKRLSILHLDYKLACDGYPLPYQLNQFAHTYSNLTEKDGNSNIILLGDSAGGNIAITFLQKIVAHNQAAANKLIYPSKAILISPWVKLQPGREQFQPGRLYYDNRRKDIIEYTLSRHLEKIDALVPPAVQVRQPALLLSPHSVKNPKREDWLEIDTFNKPNYDVFVIVGEDEVFRDDVLEWAEYALNVPLYSKQKYGDSNNVYNPEKHECIIPRSSESAHVRTYVEPWGIHDACLYFENGLLLLIQSGKVKYDNVPEKFFGLKRIAQFLNDTL